MTIKPPTQSLTVAGVTLEEPLDGSTGWGPNVSEWMSLVSTGKLDIAGGNFYLLSDVDFGPNHGLKTLFYGSRNSNIATTGIVRLANTDTIAWRNGANTLDITLGIDSDGNFVLNGNTVGTMAYEDANDVSITGGNIDGTVIGGTTPSTGTFTSVTTNALSGSYTVPVSQLSGIVQITQGGTGSGSASGARTNLGLGTAAVQDVSYFLQTANNLSDVSNRSVALNNILPSQSGYAGYVLSTDGATASWISNSAVGTVTSVGMIGDGTIFNSSVTGSPITSSGTLAPSLATQTANTILSGPSSGSASAPTFRSMVLADLPSISSNTVLANVTGSPAIPTAATPTSILDIIGSTQGDILYRNGSVWTVLAPGTNGQFLQTQGASANPQWANALTGAVTSLTGDGTIINNSASSGAVTLTLASAANNTVLSNISGSSHTPSYNSVTSLLDTFGTAQGDILYRSGSVWTVLAPGTSGQFLKTQGSGAAPVWASAVTSPASPSTSIQFNNSGSFGGSSALTWDGTSINVNSITSFTTNSLDLITPASVSSTGGISLLAGATSGSSTSGGAVQISAGGAPNGSGGAVEILSGAGGGTGSDTGSSGNIEIEAVGNNSNTGNAGYVSISAVGLSSVSNTGGDPGNIFISPGSNTESADKTTVYFGNVDISTNKGNRTSTLASFVSTKQGVSMPSMTTTQMNAITSPIDGLIVYNTTTHNLYYYNSNTSSWTQIGLGGGVVNAGTTNQVGYYASNGSTISGTSLSALIDAVIGNTQGDILYRNGSVWTVLAPGTSGNVLTTGGAGANPSWSAATGTVTSIATNNGITGGTITSSGTIGLANIATARILANISGFSNPPTANTISDVIDNSISSLQGSILYRGLSGWVGLNPGTSGYFLQTQGASANPQWAAATGSGTVNTGNTNALAFYSSTGTAVGGTSTVSVNDSSGGLIAGNSSQAGFLTVYSNGHSATINGSSFLTSNYTLTLPVDSGTTGQVLTSAGAGNTLTWTTPSGGVSKSGVIPSDTVSYTFCGGV